MNNLYDRLPSQLRDELTECLLELGPVRIERIVSTGHASPEGFWYDQPEHEWVLLLKGAARLTIDPDQTVILKPGDNVFIPARCRHRVDWTTPHEPTLWLAVFISLRGT